MGEAIAGVGHEEHLSRREGPSEAGRVRGYEAAE